MSVISAGTTTTTAFKVTGDTTGTLQLKTGAVPTTAIDISASQVVTFPATTTLDFTGALLLGDGSATAPTLAHSGDTNTGIYFPGADQIAITTAGTQRFIVDAAGNVGVGVTPSAWAGATGLQVQNAALEGRSTLPSYGTFSVNGYTDSGTWKYISTDFASRYTQFQGQHLWFTAPSGTAGNAITFTQAMTLDASGNLGVGTTSPAIAWSGSAKAIEVLSTSTLAAGVRVRSANASAELFSSGSTTEWGLYSASDAPFVMYTNNAERARITAGGVVQINTTSASEDDFYLNVKGVNAAAFGDGYDQSNYGCVQIARPADQPDNKFHLAFVRSGQQVAGIGFLDNSSTFAIQNAGDNSGAGVTLTGSATSWGTTSDERKKDIKGNLESGVAKLADWRTVYFNYKTDSEDTPQRIGLIAQDVQATVPEAVSVEEDEQGTLQLRYSELIPVLVKAIQELKAELDATKAEVAALKGG